VTSTPDQVNDGVTVGNNGNLKPMAGYPSSATGAAAADGSTTATSWSAYGSAGITSAGDKVSAYALCSTDPATPPVAVARVDVAGPDGQTGSTVTVASASCPAGTRLFGGGYSVDESVGGTGGLQPQQGYHMRGSYPSSSGTTEVANGAVNPTTWTALLQAGGQNLPAGSHMNLHGYAMCATPPPTLAMSCAPGSVRVGGSVTCTATVTGTTHPSGSVSFTSDSGGSFGPTSCTLSPIGGDRSRCAVTYTPTAAGGGTHTVTAFYSGDAGNPASQAMSTVRVGPATTTTSVSCSPGAVVVGSPSTCTATVTGPASSAPPTGPVTFARNSSGAFSSTTCLLVAGTGGSASCSVTYTPGAVGSGAHKIYARYVGDPDHAPSAGSATIAVS
jgi:hypothetical protein